MSLPKYLTLKNFLNPGGGSAMNSRLIIQNYLERYNQFIIKNVRLKAYHDGDSYVFFIHVPSEKNHKYRSNIYYDIIIEFYLPKDRSELEESKRFDEYGIRCYSNCPTFTFQYCNIYNRIAALYRKIPAELYSSEALSDPPNQTNPLKLTGIEKSIWFALHKIYLTTNYNKNKFDVIVTNPGKKNKEFVFPGDIFREVMSQVDKIEEIHNVGKIKKSKFKGTTRREFKLDGVTIGAENRTSKKSNLSNVIQKEHEKRISNLSNIPNSERFKSSSLFKKDEETNTKQPTTMSKLKTSGLKSNSLSKKK